MEYLGYTYSLKSLLFIGNSNLTEHPVFYLTTYLKRMKDQPLVCNVHYLIKIIESLYTHTQIIRGLKLKDCCIYFLT